MGLQLFDTACSGSSRTRSRVSRLPTCGGRATVWLRDITVNVVARLEGLEPTLNLGLGGTPASPTCRLYRPVFEHGRDRHVDVSRNCSHCRRCERLLGTVLRQIFSGVFPVRCIEAALSLLLSKLTAGARPIKCCRDSTTRWILYLK